MLYIQLFNEMRTGSCYLERLLIENCSEEFDWPRVAWKHDLPCRVYAEEWEAGHPTDKLVYICIIKDPYAWIYSILDAVDKGILSRGILLRCQWTGDIRTQPLLFHSLINRWNLNYSTWTSFIDSHPCAATIKYEELLANPGTVLSYTCATLGIPLKKTLNLFQSTVISPGAIVSGGLFDKKKFFLSRGYLDMLPPEAIRVVSKVADKQLMDRFGYATVVQ